MHWYTITNITDPRGAAQNIEKERYRERQRVCVREKEREKRIRGRCQQKSLTVE